MPSRFDSDIVDWISSNVVPFEANLRRRMLRHCRDQSQVDDSMQEIYCRILDMDSVEHIRDPKPFLMQMARNVLVDRYRRDTIVSIEAVADLEELEVADPAPSPERAAMARAELRWVLGLVASLPDRCREVFRARKIYGMSQLETAQSLGISENVVEKETSKALKFVSETVKRVSADVNGQGEQAKPAARKLRKRHV